MKKAFFIIFLAVTVKSFKSQTIQTDRPSVQTENSSTVYKDAFQVEYGITTSVTQDTIDNIAIPNSLYRFGISDNIEIRISNDLIFSNSFKDITISPLQFGGKFQIFKKEKSNLAFLTMIAMNSLKNESRSSFFQNINTKFIGSYSFINTINLGYTLGHNLNPVNEKNDINYSLLISKVMKNNFTAFIEFYGNINYVEEISNFSSFDFGLAYLLKDKLQLDIYTGSDLNFSNYFLAIGLSYLFIK